MPQGATKLMVMLNNQNDIPIMLNQLDTMNKLSITILLK